MPIRDEWLRYQAPVEDDSGSVSLYAFYAGAAVALSLVFRDGEDPQTLCGELERFRKITRLRMVYGIRITTD